MEEKDYGYLGGDAREWDYRAYDAEVQHSARIYLLEQKHQKEVERLRAVLKKAEDTLFDVWQDLRTTLKDIE